MRIIFAPKYVLLASCFIEPSDREFKKLFKSVMIIRNLTLTYKATESTSLFKRANGVLVKALNVLLQLLHLYRCKPALIPHL